MQHGQQTETSAHAKPATNAPTNTTNTKPAAPQQKAAAAAADVAAICAATPFLTGCSLAKACAGAAAGGKAAAAAVGSSPSICDPFQHLATICAREPGGRNLPGCRARYNLLCARGSAVRQCAAAPGFDLVGAADANKWVRSICEEMDMEGCERCTPAWKEGKKWGGPNCDPFAVYGWLCVQMPDMWQCIGKGRWDEMCKRDAKLYACTGDAPKLTDRGAAALARGGAAGRR